MAPKPLTTLVLVQTHFIELTVERRGYRHKVTNGRKINRDRRPHRPDKMEWMTTGGRPRRQWAGEGVQGRAVASNVFPFPLFFNGWESDPLTLLLLARRGGCLMLTSAPSAGLLFQKSQFLQTLLRQSNHITGVRLQKAKKHQKRDACCYVSQVLNHFTTLELHCRFF